MTFATSTTKIESGNKKIIVYLHRLPRNLFTIAPNFSVLVICIVVGQMGISGPWRGGGGGGGSSYGYGGFGSSTSIPIDGGGSGNGGYSVVGYGGNGGAFSSGYRTEVWNDAAGGGGGWQGDGGTGAIIGTADHVFGGKGRLGNFIGEYHAYYGPASTPSGNGGFGGGGGSGGYGNSGGGYTGGGGGNNYNFTWSGGQGGGSFNAGSDQVNTPDNCSTDGSVTITAL